MISADDWIDLDEEAPEKAGRYLVVQRLSRSKAYRWVRYWDSCDWINCNEEQYGPITHWCEMPPYPKL
jgi:hypothetical protein